MTINTESHPNGAIIVAINAKWKPIFETNQPSSIIRRRVPSRNVSSLYFYFNTPISAICAKCTVLSVKPVSLQRAISAKNELMMTKVDIEQYFGNRSSLWVYNFTALLYSNVKIGSNDPSAPILYNPPQNFQWIDTETCQLIDNYLFGE